MIIRFIINLLAILLIAAVVPGIHLSGVFGAIIVVVVLAVVNAVLKPVLIILTLPINILTLGLFTLVINALLFWLVAGLVPGFAVDGFWPAFWGALILSVIHMITHPLEKRAR